MLVRDLILHLTNLSKLYNKAIIVRHKEVSDYLCWSLLEDLPAAIYDYEIVEFEIWYGNITTATKELDVYMVYKKGECK